MIMSRDANTNTFYLVSDIEDCICDRSTLAEPISNIKKLLFVAYHLGFGFVVTRNRAAPNLVLVI